MNEKQLLKSLMEICEIAHTISIEIDSISGDAELLSNLIVNLFAELNPIKEKFEDWDSWTNYIESTKKYIKQENN